MSPTTRFAALAATAVVAGLVGIPVGAQPAAAQVCADIDPIDVIGWWQGEGDLLAVVGPDLTGPTGFAPGEVGQAFLPGPGSLGAAGVEEVGASLTAEAWIRPTQTGASQAILARWGTTHEDRSYALVLNHAGDRLEWWVDEPSSRFPEITTAAIPSIFDGAFHHVAATFDRGLVTIHLDGAQVASDTVRTPAVSPASVRPTTVGSGLGAGFMGEIDEPTVWNRALSTAEIGQIHAAGSAGKCLPAPGQTAKLTASDGALADLFGWSVDLDGSSAIIGAFADDTPTPDSGSAYVFTRGAGGWSEQTRLVADEPATAGDGFGWSVAIDGDTAIVGAPTDDDTATDAGAAFVFTRSGSVWTQQAKLTASDGAAFDQFGLTVALDGDTVVVGSPGNDGPIPGGGAGYVFVRSGSTWSQQAKLTAADAAAGDQLGYSVDLDGDRAVLGAPGDDSGAVDAGAAYVFVRTGTTWSEEDELVATDGTIDDSGGLSVSISGDTVVFGAPTDDDAGDAAGSAYVFTRSGAVWSEQQKLLAADTTDGDGFGQSVAVSGDAVIVGSYLDDAAGSAAGSAYVFRRSGATWSETNEFVAADAAPSDLFGADVALDGRVALIGSYLDDDNGQASGSAYVFRAF